MSNLYADVEQQLDDTWAIQDYLLWMVQDYLNFEALTEEGRILDLRITCLRLQAFLEDRDPPTIRELLETLQAQHPEEYVKVDRKAISSRCQCIRQAYERAQRKLDARAARQRAHQSA